MRKEKLSELMEKIKVQIAAAIAGCKEKLPELIKKRNVQITAAIVLVVLLNIIIACVSGREKTDRPDSEPITGHIATELPGKEPAASSGDVTEWVGWQDAQFNGNGTIYYDESMIVPMEKQPSAGEKVIVCQANDRRRLVRYGSVMGWTTDDALTASGEPTVYTDYLAGTPTPTDVVGTEITDQLDKVAKDNRCVGVQIAVINDGQISHLYQYGYQDRNNKVAISEDTKICIASLSKMIVGMGIMSMHDMGTLDIDEDISKYWGEDIKNPHFPENPITLRHILTHTSSFKDFGYNKRATSALETNLRDRGSYMKLAPGDAAAYEYNNSAICASGAIAGRAGNINFDQYIREYFFAPLGIDASFHAGNMSTTHISIVYNNGSPTIRVDELVEMPFYGGVGDDYSLYSGGMLISAKDLAKMVCILLGDGEYIGQYFLKPSSIEEMLKVYYPLEDYDQCLVLRHKDDLLDGRSLYYHNGNMAGMYSLACFDPATGDGMVVISNGSKEPKMRNGVYSVCRDLAEIAAELWADN